VNNHGVFMRKYGKQTHQIVYGDRSILVGFALVGAPLPPRRYKITCVRKGKYLGSLNPIFQIKPIGVGFCEHCPQMGDGAHTVECGPNKLKADAIKKYQAKRKAKTELTARREEGLEDGELPAAGRRATVVSRTHTETQRGADV
jgi:hypothetical protein